MPSLEHDPRLVETLALVHEANAALNFKRAAEWRESHVVEKNTRWSQHEMLAASSAVIAASYWSLIDPRKAVSIYRKASQTYQYLGHSYAMVLALASASRDDIRAVLSAVDDTPAPTPQTIAFAMVANEVVGSDPHGARLERLYGHWRHTGNVPVGRLGIPLDHYGLCAETMHVARSEKKIEDFFEGIASYINRAAEVLRSASHDRFHWLQLRSAILPAEPEAIAMTTAMSMIAHSNFRTRLAEMPNLDPQARLLVEVGDEMRSAATGLEPQAA